MTSSADVDSWNALGGRIDQSSGSWYTATGKLDLALAAQRMQFCEANCMQGNVTVLGRKQRSTWKTTWRKVFPAAFLITTARSHGACVTENCNKPSKRQPLSGNQEQKPSSKRAKLQAENPDNPKAAAVKPNSRAKQPAASAAANVKKAASDSTEEPKPQGTIVGSGRQAAQGVEYKEQTALTLPDSKVAVKQEQVAANELAALEHTKSDAVGPRR